MSQSEHASDPIGPVGPYVPIRPLDERRDPKRRQAPGDDRGKGDKRRESPNEHPPGVHAPEDHGGGPKDGHIDELA